MSLTLPRLHHQTALFLTDHLEVDFGDFGTGVSHQLRQHMNRQRPPGRDHRHPEAVTQALARGQIERISEALGPA